MKKILLISLLVLCGCSTMDEKLMLKLPTSNYPIQNVLDTVKKYGSFSKNSGQYQCEKVFTEDYSLAEDGVDPTCMLSYYKSSDYYESDYCILNRRKFKSRPSKVCYFNYKKYLPQNTSIKTDNDFLRLLQKYEKLQEKEVCQNLCYELTKSECSEAQNNCYHKVWTEWEQILREYINGGMEREIKAQKEAAQRKKEQKEKEEREARERELELQRKNEADCKQAKEKAQQKMDEITKKTGVKNFYSIDIFSSSEVVADIAKDGVFIESDCSLERAFSRLEGGASLLARCLNAPRVFVYTKDTDYAIGDDLRGHDLVYAQRGNYKYQTVNGGTYSVKAYEPLSPYKWSDIQFETYLQNKSLRCEE